MSARRMIPATALAAAFVAPVTAADFGAVASILRERCVVCHSGDAAAAGLRLDSHVAVMKGSARGPVVRPGDAGGSELVRRIRGTSQPRMPLTGPPFLSEREIATIEAWVAAGALGGDAAAPAPAGSVRPGPGEPVRYDHVAPVLLKRCVKCHTDGGLMGPPPEGYRLRTLEQALDATDRARIVPGNPGASELVRRIRGQSVPRMPFDGPPWLDEADIELIERWIAGGARDAAGNPAPVPAGARVRFAGTLTARWAVDGAVVVVDSSTRIDKSPAPGDRVEVRGSVLPDGRVRAERIRRR